MNKRLSKGFTLLELMIVVVIIALLAALAYVNYSRYAFRTRRADGREMLLRVASAEERYYTAFNRYTSTISDLQMGATLDSEKGYYRVTPVLTNGTQGFTATAAIIAGSAQVGDKCGSLSIDNAGTKLPDPSNAAANSNGACW